MLSPSAAEVLAPIATPQPPSELPAQPPAESLPDLAFRGTLWPEAEFVLLGARTDLRGARRVRWEKLLLGHNRNGGNGALNWDEVLRLATSHRVLGLLGRHLSARSWKATPAPVKTAIQNYFGFAAQHTRALQVELGQVSRMLEDAGVPVVSFKGPTLALNAYGNGVVRPSADLDLLVARADAERARDLLQKAGYAPEVELSPAQTRSALRLDSVFNMARPAPAPLQSVLPQGYAVELHWAITSPCLPFDLEYQSVAPNLGWIDLPGACEGQNCAVRALAPEDLLLILCVHGAKHLWERLIWLCDVAQLIGATPDLDWPRVLQMARERGVQRMTALGLALARDVLGAPLPRAVEDWLSTQPEALRLASRLRRQLLARPAANATSDDGQLAGHVLSADALLMQTIDDRWHRLGFLWHLATVPTLAQRATLDLPPHLDFLWWFVRPARVLQKRLKPKSQLG